MQTSKNKNTKKKASEYMREFLKVAPLSHALWRSVEALSFERFDFKKPVLDLGCGFGEFAGIVFDKVEMGIDINNEDLRMALKGKRYRNLQWADARKLPFRKGSYSTVVSVSVLEHIENSEEVVKEVSRILKKNGLFLFSVPTPEMKRHLLGVNFLSSLGLKKASEKYWDLHKRAFKHVGLQTKLWWEKILKKNGFEILKEEGTLSPSILHLHEIFLITALPSQFGKLFFDKRLMMSIGLRSRLLPIFFSRFVKPDVNSNINLFFVARKK